MRFETNIWNGYKKLKNFYMSLLQRQKEGTSLISISKIYPTKKRSGELHKLFCWQSLNSKFYHTDWKKKITNGGEISSIMNNFEYYEQLLDSNN